MCLAVPTQVVSISGQMADVEVGGVRRRISIALTPQVHVGDYVLVHTGFAIEVLDEAEALETLRLFQELDEMNQQGAEAPETAGGGAAVSPQARTG